MARHQNVSVRQHIQTLFSAGTMVGLTDRQLLERFRTRGREVAELAFETLIERHGPMVFRVCRRVLSNPDDVEDAFQATFLVLVSKSGSIQNKDSIASWLYGVAHRVASGSRSASARRRRHELLYADVTSQRSPQPEDEDELKRVLTEEIARLPERFRTPVILCDLEGLTSMQAAARLGCPVGTVKSRLARGRERLAVRLRKHRGMTLGLCLPDLTIHLSSPFGPSRALIDLTTSAARRVASDHLGAGTVAASILPLITGALWTMRLKTIKSWAVAGLLTTALAGSVIALADLPAGSNEGGLKSEHAPGIGREAKKPTLTYEVSFIKFQGLAHRSRFPGPDVALDSPANLAFLTELEHNLMLRNAQANPNFSIATSTQVFARTEEPATFHNPPGPKAGDGTAKPDRERAPDGDEAAKDPTDGCTVRVRGSRTEDGRYIALNLEIRDTHVVEIHKLGQSDKLDKAESDRDRIPEVVQTRVFPKVTVPTGAASLLIGLGPASHFSPDGVRSITDRYILIRVATPSSPKPESSRPDARDPSV